MTKRSLTGIKPTGIPHIANYIGAIRPALALSEQYDAYYFIADYHALTTVKDRQALIDLTYEVAAAWLAMGLNPDEVTLYRQSDLPEVFELTWILGCVTPKGLMNRAHAYKAAVAEAERQGKTDVDAGINMGVYYYPVLMAADILLFSADVVPVGRDQAQHLEMTRDIAEKFNLAYGDVADDPGTGGQLDRGQHPGPGRPEDEQVLQQRPAAVRRAGRAGPADPPVQDRLHRGRRAEGPRIYGPVPDLPGDRRPGRRPAGPAGPRRGRDVVERAQGCGA